MGDAAPTDSDSHFFSWTGDWRALPAATLGALALGGGARFIRGLWETAQEEPSEISGKIRRPRAPIADIPVTVSPEEAEELRRRGVRVRRILREQVKAAGDASTPTPSFWRSLGYGAATAGAGLAGWELADWVIDNLRKSYAKRDVRRTRERLERLLDEAPEDADIKVAAAIAQAADRLTKTGETTGWFQDVVSGPVDMSWGDLFSGLKAIGGLGIGAGTLLSFIASMRRAKDESKHRKRVSELGRFLRGRRTEAPLAAMQPVVYE